MTSVVIDAAAAGSLALVRSADSCTRQTSSPEIIVALSGNAPATGIIESLVDRLQVIVERGASSAAAINAAVERASGDSVVVLSAPWRILPEMIERCASVLDSRSDAGVVLPGLRLQSMDGRTLRTFTPSPTLPHLLANPMSTPPVFMTRRTVWNAVGGLEESSGGLARCDWYLRLLSKDAGLVALDEPLAVLEAGNRQWWPPIVSEPLNPAAYRAVLERHRALLDSRMTDLVVKLEMASGLVFANHREQISHRDRRLVELERVRAETSHHDAYLRHHNSLAVDWGDFRRVDPTSRDWGYDRGTPVDRRYIEDFLAAHSSDITGAVLEVQEDDFTRRFGGPRVTASDVVDLNDSNPRATIVADLRAAAAMESAGFDCIILTQTLHVIDGMAAVVGECFRLLRPGGVLLATLPAASRVCLEYGEDGDLWRTTQAGARALFEPVFGASNVEVTAYGNVLTNVAFLHGLSCAEVKDEEFAATDPYHPLLLGVRASREISSPFMARSRKHNGAVLLYHRVDEEADVHDLTIPAATLDQHFTWLAKECQVMPLEQLLRSARDGFPERAVAITFDDGYLDTLEAAAPVLERHGLPATVFATSQWLEQPGQYWWDVLERALLTADAPATLTVALDGVPVTFPTATSDDRRAVHDRLHGRLVHSSLEERDRVLSAVEQWSGCASDRHRRPLMAEELRRLARVPGISIGAHTVNHLSLPDQAPATQRREVLDSIRALEHVVGQPVDAFAFPYGAMDRASAGLIRETCRWSVSCQPASVGRWFDAAVVPRLEVKRWDRPTLSLRLEQLFSDTPR